jgi:hypothetical protein
MASERATFEIRPLAQTRTTPLGVRLRPNAETMLARDLDLSDRWEEGGFLLGYIACDCVHITHVSPVLPVTSSVTRFTFPPESFLDIAKVIRTRGQDEDLVGWYHTHLFGPELDMGTGIGLSDLDIALHRSVFRRPGQVACLVNLTSDGRTVRFYADSDGQIQEWPQ